RILTVASIIYLNLSFEHTSERVYMNLTDNQPYTAAGDLLTYQSQERPTKSCLLYPNPSNSAEYLSATYAQVYQFTTRLSRRFLSQYFNDNPPSTSTVICILSNCTTECFLTIYALLKLPNVIIFLLSTRNSKTAIEYLINETQAKYVFTTKDYLKTLPLIATLKIIEFDNDVHIDELQELATVGDKENLRSQQLDEIQMIFHSSGSTAYPKPVRLTNRYFFNMYYFTSSVNKDWYTENDVVLAWGALYHIFAFWTSVTVWQVGGCYALPLTKVYPPTPKELVLNINQQITKMITVPVLLEQLVNEINSQSKPNFESLKKMIFVMYGGASCPDNVCQMLVDNGVHLISIYGSTETGISLIRNFSLPSKQWKWMSILPIRKPFVRLVGNDNEKELIHLPNDPFLTVKISNRPDGSYSTGDILIEDPPGSGYYLVLGRKDDTLVHINGEKTNPKPIENLMNSNMLVKKCVVIGHQRICNCLLIELNWSQVGDYDFQEIEQQLWFTCEQANQFVPSHSRIMKEMMKILPMNKHLPVTDKGNIMRNKAVVEFQTITDKMYQKFLNINDANNHSHLFQQWTYETLKTYLKSNIQHFNEIDSYQSLFDNYGFDSLSALQLRHQICKDIVEVEQNFLYEYSSIDKIVRELLVKLEGSYNKQNKGDDPYHCKWMEHIIEEYEKIIQQEPPSSGENTEAIMKRVFLITGANGSLGSWIVHDLLKQSSVDKVYCLLRGTDVRRFYQTFEQRYDEQILRDNKQRFHILISMDLSQEHLGQTSQIFEELQHNVTDIIHSAWKMNFNFNVQDFEYDCIRGVYNLLKLAKTTSSKRFHFISSIASAGNSKNDVREEPLPRQSDLPLLGQGYGQSKYIGEHLCWIAMKQWGILVDVYRVGQISGDTEYGIWNTSEMIPLIICGGGGQLGQMPDSGQPISWIPVNIVSNCIVDIALQSYSHDKNVHHLLNPHTIEWSQFLNELSQIGLKFQIISMEKWLQIILQNTSTDNPLMKISSYLESSSNIRMAHYETKKTTDRTKYFKQCPQIDQKLIRKYLNYWNKIGFLKNGYEPSEQ
ncbi:unnamed protein product, partial [Didymodactylos carnosus]